MRYGMMWIDTQGLAAASLRFRGLPLTVERQCQITERIDELRICPQGFSVTANRLLGLFQVLQHIAVDVESIGVV